MRKPRESVSPLWIVAHRGAKCEAPENTRSAFDAALACPVDGIELDVQMSKDEVPVLYHDKTMAKINGGRKKIADFSFQELYKLDWGRWFSKGFHGEHILTLDKVLQLYRKRTRLLIEIKSHERDRRSGRSRILTSRVLELLKSRVPSACSKNIFILSFDPEVLRFAYGQAPCWKYVLNVSEPFPVTNKSLPGMDHLYAYCAPIKYLTRDPVDIVHARGQRVMTYSCNIAKQVEKALEFNADVIMTDKPGWLTGYLRKRDLNRR